MRGGAKCGHGFTTKMRRCTAMNVLKTERKTLSLQAAVRLTSSMVRHSETEDHKNATQSKQQRSHMSTAVNNCFLEEDKAIKKMLKVVSR